MLARLLYLLDKAIEKDDRYQMLVISESILYQCTLDDIEIGSGDLWWDDEDEDDFFDIIFEPLDPSEEEDKEILEMPRECTVTGMEYDSTHDMMFYDFENCEGDLIHQCSSNELSQSTCRIFAKSLATRLQSHFEMEIELGEGNYPHIGSCKSFYHREEEHFNCKLDEENI